MFLVGITSSNENLSSFSPCGTLIAFAFKCTLSIQCKEYSNPVRNFKCVGFIGDIKWSPDAKCIFCIIKQKNIIQVFTLEHSTCCCNIDAGDYLGIQEACWTPNGHHIMVFSEYSALLTLWTLSGSRVAVLGNPKNFMKSLAFSHDGRFLCMLECIDAKDTLHFYDTKDPQWCRFLSAPLFTRDAKCVEWSPDGRYIAVFDSCLYGSVFVLNADGSALCTLNLYSDKVGNELIVRFSLGIRSFQWACSGHILAVGRFDNSCLLYNHANWKVLAELKHPLDKPLDPILGLDFSGGVAEGPVKDRLMKSHKVAIYLQKSIRDHHIYGLPFATTTRAEEIKDAYTVSRLPYTVKSVKKDPKNSSFKTGVGLCLFSPNGRYLVTRVENAPHALWIWSICGLRLTLVELLCHSSAVTCVQWDPHVSSIEFTRLAFCTAAGQVFVWSPRGCLSLMVEKPGSSYPVKSLVWSSSGDALLLRSTKSFCVLNLVSKSDSGISKPMESVWTAPFTGRDPLEEQNRDPQTPASHGNFPSDVKSDLPRWALSAHRKARKLSTE